MVVVGADVHKHSHTFVAVDEVGRKIGEKTVRAITAGHAEAVMWARERFGNRGGVGDRGLPASIGAVGTRLCLRFGQKVVRVPPKLMAQTRAKRALGASPTRSTRWPWRGIPAGNHLPVASHDEVSRELKLLVDRLEVLVAQRTATINRLRWPVHELDPERAPCPGFVGSCQTSSTAGRLVAHRARTGRRVGWRRARRHHPAHRGNQRAGQAHR